VQRLDVDHPVVNDRMFRIWRAYGIWAWPTLVLIDPDGKVRATRPGETSADDWIAILKPLIAEYDARGSLKPQSLPVANVQKPDPARHLRYPEKLLVRENTIVIADTGHHRIVIGKLDRDAVQVTKIIGSGERGRDDGPAPRASFRQPRGLALIDRTLYIADTGNHLLRAVDLDSGVVTTVGGTGARGTAPFTGGSGNTIPIASPWDLAVHNGRIAIAMAGSHQLWIFDPADGSLAPLAGTGREELVDGPPPDASFAQPCGIASDGGALWTADSEAQAIRRITTGADGSVTTLIGTGLFDYGDHDGVGDAAVLQHPQAIAFHAGRLYVADSYNHKIKIVDPTTRECTTWLGRRRIPGNADGPADAAEFSEPGGLGIANGTLYIADTDNHAIRAAELATGVVRTVSVGT
jgi:hypothetical protein